jgi:hypothetical protein
MQSRRAGPSPPFAISMAFSINSFALALSNSSKRIVVAFLHPFGLPLGFPLCPFLNFGIGMPQHLFLPCYFQTPLRNLEAVKSL